MFCSIVNFCKCKGPTWCSYLRCLLLYFEVIAEIGVAMTQCGFSSERELKWPFMSHLSLTIRFGPSQIQLSALSFLGDQIFLFTPFPVLCSFGSLIERMNHTICFFHSRETWKQPPSCLSSVLDDVYLIYENLKLVSLSLRCSRIQGSRSGWKARECNIRVHVEDLKSFYMCFCQEYLCCVCHVLMLHLEYGL